MAYWQGRQQAASKPSVGKNQRSFGPGINHLRILSCRQSASPRPSRGFIRAGYRIGFSPGGFFAGILLHLFVSGATPEREDPGNP